MRQASGRAGFRPRGLIGPRALLSLYRRRLRAQFAGEILAGFGGGVAVALIFAALAANGSIAGSVKSVLHQITGPATLQMRTRSPEGFDQSVLAQVEALPPVAQAAPVLEQTATIRAPSGRYSTLLLVGGDVALTTLDGLAHTLPASTLERGSLALTREAAESLGLYGSGRRVADTPVLADVRGRRFQLKVATVLGQEAVGPISQTRIAVMPLEELQRITSLPHRLSRIFVLPKPGEQVQARRALDSLAANRISVARPDQDLNELSEVLRPSDQASALFTAIATLLGFLFAFNAMLLTAPERRQAIADFRLGGVRRSVIIEMVIFQAVCLGLAAAILGAVGGYVLVRTAFHERPGYLAEAFTLGGGTVLGLGPLLIAVGAGILATLLASCIPLLDLRRGRALDAVYLDDGEPGNWIAATATRRLAAAAVVLVVAATALWRLDPSLTVLAVALAACASVLAVPLCFRAILGLLQRLVDHWERFTALSVALRSLRATTLRSLALIATGVVALFGSVALGGARSELFTGLERGAQAYTADGQLWVLNPGLIPETTPFSSEAATARIKHLKGIERVATMTNAFIDLGGRRVLVVARPSGTGGRILSTQLISGSRRRALRELQAGGWLTLSQQLANEENTQPGRPLRLATATGTVIMRVAATTTNLGWPGGAIMMNSADFDRLWATEAPTALALTLAPGRNVEAERDLVSAALGPDSGLRVLTAMAWRQRFNSNVREGLGQLGQISLLLLLAAILSMAAALGSTIWQRRESLSALRLSGVRPPRIRHILLNEVLLLLGTGCFIGILAGLYGEIMIASYLKQVTGFPVGTFSIGWYPLIILAAVIGLVLVLIGIPGWIASRVAPTMALASE